MQQGTARLRRPTAPYRVRYRVGVMRGREKRQNQSCWTLGGDSLFQPEMRAQQAEEQDNQEPHLTHPHHTPREMGGNQGEGKTLAMCCVTLNHITQWARPRFPCLRSGNSSQGLWVLCRGHTAGSHRDLGTLAWPLAHPLHHRLMWCGKSKWLKAQLRACGSAAPFTFWEGEGALTWPGERAVGRWGKPIGHCHYRRWCRPWLQAPS